MKTTFLAVIAALAACSQGSPATTAVTAAARVGTDSIMLRVANSSGTPVVIKGMPNLSPPVPQPLGGIILIGNASPGTTCMALPSTIIFHGGDQRWVSTQPLAISALDSTTITMLGSAVTFTPADSPAWDVAVSAGQITVTAGTPCRSGGGPAAGS